LEIILDKRFLVWYNSSMKVRLGIKEWIIFICLFFLTSCATTKVDVGKIYLQTVLFPTEILVLGVSSIPK